MPPLVKASFSGRSHRSALCLSRKIKILGAWARLHRESKLAAREVRAANRPRLGHVRS